jgi:VIT1/CCC1 family predicted Fe2+/Mn2+ transporter
MQETTYGELRECDYILESHPTTSKKLYPQRLGTKSRMYKRHRERHRTDRTGWLRATVLGANDGIVSTASLIVGVAAADASRSAVLTAAVAALVAGAMSMAAGEYVSVSSQADTENADLERERKELAADVESERKELAAIYANRGVEAHLAHEVAGQLMAHDALGAHARDELGISEMLTARPVQAAMTSAVTFAAGAALPVLTVLVSPAEQLVAAVSMSALFFLALLGVLAANTGGSSKLRGALRVTFWGATALLITGVVGRLFGAMV